MGFVIDKKPTFRHPVEIKVPADGGYQSETLEVTFRYVPEDPEKVYSYDDSVALLKERIETFHDLEDSEGNVIECNEAVIDGMLEMPWIRNGLMLGYNIIVNRLAAGNLQTPAAPGGTAGSTPVH